MDQPSQWGRWIAIDYGERRIGLAVTDPTRTIASPAGTIARRAGKRPPIAELLQHTARHDAVAIVMGLPLDSDGEETERAAEVRLVGETLARRSGLPVRYVDERCSTAAALRAVRALDGS